MAGDDRDQSEQDIFELFGISLAPPTQEEIVYKRLTDDRNRLGNMTYWLRHQMDVHCFACESFTMTHQLTKKPVTHNHYAQQMIHYFLHMHHLPSFVRLNASDPQPAKIEVVTKMLLDHEEIKKAIKPRS